MRPFGRDGPTRLAFDAAAARMRYAEQAAQGAEEGERQQGVAGALAVFFVHGDVSYAGGIEDASRLSGALTLPVVSASRLSVAQPS
jgi:hypothetical protein